LEKTLVGGTKKVKFPLIRDLKPDFILCSKEENTREMVEELEKIAPVYVSDVTDYNSALLLIEHLGKLLNRRTQAQKLLQKIAFEKEETEVFLKNFPVLRGMYFIWANPYMAAAGDTFISDMMRLAKIENVLAENKRYPEVNIKRIRILYKPDVFLFSSEPYDFQDEDVYEVMRYNRKTVAIYVDGQYFTWYGSRLAKAFAYFRELRSKI
jgi:ABC-type Fe3+-hydroxamate transport system substrate-binding protein